MKFDLGEDLLSREEQNEARDSWINRARAHRRGGQAGPLDRARERREERAVDSIKPTAPVNIEPPSQYLKKMKILTGDEETEGTNVAANKESGFARRLRQLKEAKRKELAALAEADSAQGKMSAAVNKYKRIKRIVQAVKIISAAGASVGDVLVSAGTFLVTAHVEWIYSKFNANYPFAPWERRLVIFVDIIIFLELLAIAVIITVIYQQYQGGGSTLLKFIGK